MNIVRKILTAWAITLSLSAAGQTTTTTGCTPFDNIYRISGTTAITVTPTLMPGTILYQGRGTLLPDNIDPTTAGMFADCDDKSPDYYEMPTPNLDLNFGEKSDTFESHNHSIGPGGDAANTSVSIEMTYRGQRVFSEKCRFNDAMPYTQQGDLSTGQLARGCVFAKPLLLPITARNGRRGVYLDPGDLMFSWVWTYDGPGPIGWTSGFNLNMSFSFSTAMVYPRVWPLGAPHITVIPCVVSPAYQAQTITLGNISPSDLQANGSAITKGEKLAHFEASCLPNVHNIPMQITITSPDGQGAGTNLLPVASEKPAARGVGLALFSATSETPLTLNEPIPMQAAPLNLDSLTLQSFDFRVRYIKTDQTVTAGSVSGSAWLNISYL
ncbi:fimbrial protein [Burkholderia sp. L27(2015)]|uniref:fimbrial protein n=1 Tax=Burkholderia sp. L27(2015) TaxID=1641858 RepID=UPI00131B4587|nr:fimbrial protein [Burkholderia sp. L27(2015)]